MWAGMGSFFTFGKEPVDCFVFALFMCNFVVRYKRDEDKSARVLCMRCLE